MAEIVNLSNEENGEDCYIICGEEEVEEVLKLLEGKID
jgi:hypothetical protein